jgi:hypothetical protein
MELFNHKKVQDELFLNSIPFELYMRYKNELDTFCKKHSENTELIEWFVKNKIEELKKQLVLMKRY